MELENALTHHEGTCGSQIPVCEAQSLPPLEIHVFLKKKIRKLNSIYKKIGNYKRLKID